MSKLDELLHLIKEREKENAQLRMEIAKVLKAGAALSKQQKLDPIVQDCARTEKMGLEHDSVIHCDET